MTANELMTKLSDGIKTILRSDLSYFSDCGDCIEKLSDISIWLDKCVVVHPCDAITFNGEVELWLVMHNTNKDLMSQRFQISGTAIVNDQEVTEVNKPLSIYKQ